jgi:GAF domain-containing protein/predicted pyridoxine 5'-phosphate oxidase superfamily flavin-nucleotide-binding protein
MTPADDRDARHGLNAVRNCFHGVVPAVIATASADGTPNVTFLSRVCLVDNERVALSNQFFSKTARNLAENPRASVLLVDPVNYEQYRLTLVYERTERRGPVFERLREDVDAIASITGMQAVFKLRAADIYRTVQIERVTRGGSRPVPPPFAGPVGTGASFAGMAELSARLGRCGDLDALVSVTISGLAELFGFDHTLILLLDEEGKRLYTIASRGYGTEGVGSEVIVGEGIIGMAAARAAPMRVGNLRQMAKYSRQVRRSYEGTGEIGPGHEIPVPGLADANSRVAVPLMALGQLVGVLVVESRRSVAFDDDDEALLTAIGSVLGSAIEAERARERDEQASSAPPQTASAPSNEGVATTVRFFAVDGSTFLDGDYLIKGVAGRVLWSLLHRYETDGRVDFTNREVRLDPTLELPDFRDNLESRLTLLKRRLQERGASIQIEKTGRGRFRLVVTTALNLEGVDAPR